MRTAWNKTHWTKEMDNFLVNNHPNMTNQQLADGLGLKLTTTRKRCYELGLYRMRLQYWTAEQVHFLESNYKEKGDTELAEIFTELWHKEKGWTKKHIEKKRRYLKLKRTENQKLKIRQRNIDNGRFAMSSVNMWKTRGVFSEGTVRIWETKLGRVFKVIKINGEFKSLSRHRYEAAFGAISTGHNITFRDGDSLNCELSNLELVSDIRNMLQNSFVNYPKEIIPSMELVCKIKEHLNNDKKNLKPEQNEKQQQPRQSKRIIVPNA